MARDVACFRLETLLRLFWGRGTRHEIHQVQALRSFMMGNYPLPNRPWATKMCRKALLAQFPWLKDHVESPWMRLMLLMPWDEKNRRFSPATWKFYTELFEEGMWVRRFSDAELAPMVLNHGNPPPAAGTPRGELVPPETLEGLRARQRAAPCSSRL